MIESVDAVEGEQIRIERELTCECPYDDVTDHYTVVITFRTAGETVEYGSLAETFGDLDGVTMAQEEVAKYLYADLALLDIDEISVTVSGEQYGMHVEVCVE